MVIVSQRLAIINNNQQIGGDKMVVKKVRKRTGEIVPFDENRIISAISKAIFAVREKDGKFAKKLSDKVVKIINNKYAHGTPTVEDIQDIVESVLVSEGLYKTAKAYILYRSASSELRELRRLIGVRDDLKFDPYILTILQRRYLKRDEKGRILETPYQMFERVAKAVAKADKNYINNGKGNEKRIEDTEKIFLKAMAESEFMPNSPTLMNAGFGKGTLSACFVIPVGDSLEEIFRALNEMAVVQQKGGGTGFNFSKLRPTGDIVHSTMGIASGPVSFMNIFNITTETIKQGGRRRGASMGILNFNHPNILSFIRVKQNPEKLKNFNISVAVTDREMEAIMNGEDYNLINPRTNKSAGKLNAGEVFDEIIASAWKTGDPGMIFIDEINRHNPTPKLGRIESTNPCGEQPLLPYESCNLGSINMTKALKKGEIDWDKFNDLVDLGVHFLDNVIDINNYTSPLFEEMARKNRKIGLGIMGFADLLFSMRIRYNSNEALRLGEKIAKKMKKFGREKSKELAFERGSFPTFDGSTLKNYAAMRNATITTIAPTGTISLIAGCSSSIEPVFAISYIREVFGGMSMPQINEVFKNVAKSRGFYSKELMYRISRAGSIQDNKDVPKDVKRVFVTAFDIEPEWHIKMQASFQKYIDNAVSKTINLPETASIEDVKNAYLLAYKLKCKGITIFRYNSKEQQVLYIPGKGRMKEYTERSLIEEPEKFVRESSKHPKECDICF